MEATVPDSTTIPKGYKWCSKGVNCVHPDGPVLPLDCYFRQKDHKDGLRSNCKACEKKRHQKYHIEHVEQELERGRKYYAEHREEQLRRNRKWHVEHHEQKRERERRWMKNYPEKKRAKDHAHRARRRNARGSHTAADIRAIYTQQKGRCYWCQKPAGDNYHVDRRIPLTRGGSNNPDNLVITCPKCNITKGSRLPHEFCGRLL
jgi:5-methylcytosine-specific restriction endonuclease McrA